MPALPFPAEEPSGEGALPAARPERGRGGDPDPAVLAARDGDRLAFERLHAAHEGMVRAVLLAHAPRTDVDDLLQDVFLTAWESVSTLRDPGAFAPWLASIARNRARDAHRRAHGAVPLVDLPARPAPPSDDAREALAALRALPDAYRETMSLRFVAGLSGPEIAERLGMTPGSVRVNLCRGLALLKERLGWAKERT